MALLERCPELQAACGHVRKRGKYLYGRRLYQEMVG